MAVVVDIPELVFPVALVAVVVLLETLLIKTVDQELLDRDMLAVEVSTSLAFGKVVAVVVELVPLDKTDTKLNQAAQVKLVPAATVYLHRLLDQR